MIKKLAVLGLVLLGAFTIVACKPTINVPEDEQVPSEPVVPDVPKEDDFDWDSIIENFKEYDDFNAELTMGNPYEIDLDIKKNNVKYIKIVIKEKESKGSDVPLNFSDWRVDGESVTFSGVTGASYVEKHKFNIGRLNAYGNLVNTHTVKGTLDLRLHTWHKEKGTDGYIMINVEGLERLQFDIKVTTTAVGNFAGLRVYTITK